MAKPTFANAKPETLAAAILSGTYDDGSTTFTLPTSATITGGVSITNDGTFSKETGGHLANIDTEIGSHLSNIDTHIPAQGQAVMASSTPVAIASDQTAVPVSAASLPLPTGAATAANQATGNTSVANIDTDLGAKADAAATTDTGTFSLIALIKRLLATTLAKGQAVMASSLPVAIASDQSSVPVGQASLTTSAVSSDITLSAGSNTVAAISGQKGIYIFNNDASIHMRWALDSGVSSSKGARLPASTGLFILASGSVFVAPESGTPVLSFTGVK